MIGFRAAASVTSCCTTVMNHEAAQQLLPADCDVEMTSVTMDPFRGGGTARRRARVLKRLEALDPDMRGNIDKQQLVRLTDPAGCRKSLLMSTAEHADHVVISGHPRCDLV